MFDCAGVRRICYPDRDEGEEYGATFVPVCPKCGRFVRPDPTMSFEYRGVSSYSPYIVPVEPNATCGRCGRVGMPFEGFV